jgi:hypothetical protein
MPKEPDNDTAPVDAATAPVEVPRLWPEPPYACGESLGLSVAGRSGTSLDTGGGPLGPLKGVSAPSLIRSALKKLTMLEKLMTKVYPGL